MTVQDNDKTLFERLSSSIDEMTTFLAEDPLVTVCDVVCHGHCTAISGFSGNAYAVCKKNIYDFLNKRDECD